MKTNKRKFAVGDKVQLHGSFLRSTGQFAGGDAHRKWTIVACDCSICATGRFVATDEPHYEDPNRGRHFNVANLKHYGRPSVLDDSLSFEQRSRILEEQIAAQLEPDEATP